jgi:hypothetical protein
MKRWLSSASGRFLQKTLHFFFGKVALNLSLYHVTKANLNCVLKGGGQNAFHRILLPQPRSRSERSPLQPALATQSQTILLYDHITISLSSVTEIFQGNPFFTIVSPSQPLQSSRNSIALNPGLPPNLSPIRTPTDPRTEHRQPWHPPAAMAPMKPSNNHRSSSNYGEGIVRQANILASCYVVDPSAASQLKGLHYCTTGVTGAEWYS